MLRGHSDLDLRGVEMSKVAQSIKQGLKEAIAYAKGKPAKSAARKKRATKRP